MGMYGTAVRGWEGGGGGGQADADLAGAARRSTPEGLADDDQAGPTERRAVPRGPKLLRLGRRLPVPAAVRCEGCVPSWRCRRHRGAGARH